MALANRLIFIFSNKKTFTTRFIRIIGCKGVDRARVTLSGINSLMYFEF